MPDNVLKKPMYRMPVSFGPTPGPRQGPDGKPFANLSESRRRTIEVTFRSDAKQLESLLPPGFVLDGESLVTLEYQYLTNLAWLAGRGYNILSVKIPTVFQGKTKKVRGPFLAVLWENSPDAILSGREELGFSKLYCELPPVRRFEGQEHYVASWEGHEFFHMNVKPIEEMDTSTLSAPKADGVLHYKYMPRTGEWGTEEIAYAAITPVTTGHVQVKKKWRCDGAASFSKASWEQLPTLHHIVNKLADLKNFGVVSSTITETAGTTDLSEQKIVD